MNDALPQVAISILQPWSWLIVNGHKDIENRDWPTGHRGSVLIHAGKGLDEIADILLRRGKHPALLAPPGGTHPDLVLDLPPQWERGGIVGVADIVDCVTWGSGSSSSWYTGKYGFVLANARPLPFMPLRGQLGFFKATYVQPETAA